MRLSIENGAVVLSQENKNNLFLNECHGMFLGWINGKQKMYWLEPEQAASADSAVEYNAETLNLILINAKLYGSGESARIFGVVEIDEEVLQLNAELQAKAKEVKERRRAFFAQIHSQDENRQDWSRLCNHGCGKCKNLAYDIDIPMCRQTGLILQEKLVSGISKGKHYCVKPEPFPLEECPFNINKNKEKETV